MAEPRRTKVGTIRPNTRVTPKTVRDLRDFDPEDLDEMMHVEDEKPPVRKRDPRRRPA